MKSYHCEKVRITAECIGHFINFQTVLASLTNLIAFLRFLPFYYGQLTSIIRILHSCCKAFFQALSQIPKYLLPKIYLGFSFCSKVTKTSCKLKCSMLILIE